MQNLTVKEYAGIIKGQRPDLSNVEDDYLAREYLGYYPEHRDLFNKESLSNLYKIKGSERGSDYQFSEFQGKEMLANIPSAVVGGLGALTGNKDIIDYSEELRAKALVDTRKRMAEPELQGYLQWMEDEPITFKNMLQPQMFQRGFAQAAPSIAAMLAVDIGLNLVTTGIGGTALRAATGGFKAISAAKKGSTAASGATKFVKASENIRTAGTMTTMGAMEGSEQYNSTIQYLLEKGVGLEQANKVAAISGAAYAVASSILETIPYGAFKKRMGIGSIKNRKVFQERMLSALEKQGALKTGKTITKPMVQQAILESGTEYSQYLTSNLLDYYVKRGYEEVPETALKYLHKQMFTPEGIESAYSGGVMGVTMGFFPGAKTALSGKSRIEQVLAETDKEVIKDISSDKESEQPIETSSINSKVKLGAFINSYDNLSNEEEEIAKDLSLNYIDDSKSSLKEIKDVIDNDPEALNDLSDEERFDVFAGVSDLDPELSIEDLQKNWESSLEKEDSIDEPSEQIPIDEPVQTEQKKPLDITPPKKKSKNKKLADIGRVNLTYDDKGDIQLKVDDKPVDLDEEQLDALQTGIAQAEEENDDTKVEQAMLSILETVDDEPSQVKDEIIDEPQEESAIDITPKKETLPKLRKRAQELGIENVKKKNKKELLSEIDKIEESKKVEEAVEAKTKALNPEVFEDEISDDPVLQKRLDEIEDAEFKPEPLNKRLIKKLGLSEKEQKDSVKRAEIEYQKFKDDPIASIKEKISFLQESLDKGFLADTPEAKKRLEKRVYNMKRVLALLPLKKAEVKDKPNEEGFTTNIPEGEDPTVEKDGALLTEKEQLQNISTELEKEGNEDKKPRKLTNQEKAMGFEEGDIEASIAATEEMMEQEKRAEEINNEVSLENELVEKTAPKEEVVQSKEKAKLKEAEPKDDIVDNKVDVESDIFQERLNSKDFHYTEGQKNVLSKISNYLTSKIENIKENYFVFAGYAGTGKTTVVENIANHAKKMGMDVFVAAPTNKAVLRLDEKRKEELEDSNIQSRYDAALSTLHVILYGSPDENGLWVPKTSMFTEKTLVIIDEASMIDETIWDDIQKYISPTGAKIILIGDGFQLPPVGADPHLMDRFVNKGYQLVNVVRQAAESGIIKWATALRVNKSVLYPNESSDDVSIMSENELLEKYYDDIINNEDSIVIVSTNNDRIRINSGARQRKFGEKASINLINNNEHLIVVNNSKFKRKNGETFIYEGKDIIPSEGIEIEYVEKMGWNKETRKADIPQYKKTTIYAFEDSEGNPILVAPDLVSASLHGGSITLADERLGKDDMGKLAKAFPKHFTYNAKKSKYQFADTTNVVTYGYAITAHKSQGSEWKKVYVAKDFGWAKFMDDEQKARWLYTAITRASENVFLNRSLITDGASWDEIQFTMSRAGAVENDNTTEKLQEIRSGKRILGNKELSNKIAKRLQKQFPFVDAIAVQRVYDRFGREVAGKAIDSMVMWSINEGTLDTVPHEYAHIYLDLLSESPIVKKGIEKFREKNDTLEQGEERLVQYMGEYYVDRIQEKSLLKKLTIWLKQFWLNIKKPFNKMTKEEMGNYLGEKFYQDSIAKQTESLSGEVRYQTIATGSQAFMEAVQSFEDGYNSYKKYIKKNSGWIKKNSISEDDLISQYLNILYAKDINPAFDLPLKAFLNKHKYTDGNQFNIDFEIDDSLEFFENIWENLNKNLFSVSVKDRELKSVNKTSSTFMKDLGIVSKITLNRLFRTARRVDIKSFIEVVAKSVKISLDNVTEKQRRAIVQIFNSARSSVKTNRDNIRENERIGYELRLIEIPFTKKGKRPFVSQVVTKEDKSQVIQYFKIERKIKTNEKTGRDNPRHDRKYILENAINLQELSWISSGDIISTIATSQQEIKNAEEQSLYAPLTSKQISLLGKTLREKNKDGTYKATGTKDSLMVAFNRGEKQKYGLVLVTEENRNSVNEGESYWQDKNLTKKQIDNFMLKRYEGYDGISKELLEIMKAEEIARFEVLEKIFPEHMKIDAAKVFKRLKLPLTPAVVSKDLPNQIGRIFDKDNATFVVKGEDGKDKAVSAMVNVEGQEKYRLDGSSLTSTKLFKDFIKYFGMKMDVSKAKTVIAAIGEAGKLFVKHQHFKPLKPVSIYENYGKENEVLVAKIDENGNIFDSNGDDIHVLFTDDEAKVFDGDYANGENFVIPGAAFGLLSMTNRKHSDTKSTMQLYNYIHDKAILDLWKSQMFPTFRERLRKAFVMGRVSESKNPQLQIKQFFEVLSNTDSDLPDSAFELFKLGLGLHSFGSPLLDKIVQTQIVEEATTMAKMPGLSGDTIADYTDELKYTEISVPISDATIIIKDYMEANPNDKREFRDIQREGMKQVNDWLKTANYQMLISRSPVPHIGGAKMVTVKSVHGNDGQIHVNWLLLFKDLEGDGDGDKVQIEKLPKPLEEEFVKLYKDLEVKAINLDKLGNPKKYDLSLREDLNKLMSAITYGSKAIAEVSNIQMSFGILQETFDYIEFKDSDDSIYKLKIRNGNDIVKDKGSGLTDTLDNILRIYLQASVDNVEFLLLKNWGYNQETLAETLFYRDDKQPLTPRDMEAVTALMKTVKKSSNIRYGRSFKYGSFSFSRTISESALFNKFTKNKEEHIKNILFKQSPSSISYNKEGKVVFGKDTETDILDVRFKLDSSGNFNLHPHEMIAAEIANMYEGFEKSWHDGSPYKINADMYFQAHLHTINQMSKDDSIREELEGSGAIKGVTYARTMGMNLDAMFIKLKAEGKEIGINGWDTNDDMIAFLDKFKNMFEDLTPIEKRAATYQYLQGTPKSDGRRISERQIILPSSKDPFKVSLLDADVLSDFFDTYNDFLSDKIKVEKMKNNPLISKNVERLNFILMTQDEKYIKKNCGG